MINDESSKIKSDEETEEDKVKSCNIIIIGAGVAGLSAANSLFKNDINDFIILEARNRCGGRVVAIELEKQKYELGANWIHGILGNPIYELASANGLVSVIQEAPVHNVIAVLPNGEKVAFTTLEETYAAYIQFFKRCEEYYICKYTPPDNIISVGEHIKLEISIYLRKFTGKDKDIRQNIFSYLLHRETCISGCNSMNEMDLIEIGSYTELPGGNIILPNGYSSILGPLMKDIPSDKVWKNHEVKEITWKKAINTDSRENISKNDNYISLKSKIEVVCSNGTKLIANHVICTIPLGVLKETVFDLFKPSLPDSILNSINRLCFGVVDKIFLEYDIPFMDSSLSEVVFLWGEIDYSESLSERWFKKIYSFYKVNETLLLGWISGEEAKYMESLTFDDVANACTKILRQYLNDPFIPTPKRCICTSWWSQPYTRGSYTSIPCGSSVADLLNLAKPLRADPASAKPSLLFAGEHCHSHFYSTVHGAFISGCDAAQSLCDPKAGEDTPLEAGLSSWIEGISLT